MSSMEEQASVNRRVAKSNVLPIFVVLLLFKMAKNDPLTLIETVIV